MKKWIAVCALILQLMLLTACSGAQHNTELEKKVSSLVEHKKSIDINSYTTFKWDRAYLFGPYTSQEYINKELGFKFKDPSDLAFQDDVYLLVFVKDKQVIQFIELPCFKPKKSYNYSISYAYGIMYLTPDRDKIYVNGGE
ncbi:hypothetical protein NIE88_06090 [Sporolactobacillus shoreicorticis]|uniref:Lipoprotein n=1 Tax=Sporolactobacillus shoreicorticis TaxID=1923877 RepID=A0ABW5S354_9BACL|nr:hypothetical protein [Sporolactobacillus shoreicorticis]MCO7125335.1 hypothetical protein [Sporolactobacillus shoreicorticis]